MRDGSPQVTMVWVDHEDVEYVLVNTAEGRAKLRNIVRDPRVAISIASQSDPYHTVTIRGRVVDFVRGRQAEDHIDKLAKKYLGKEKYSYRREGEKRVILRIRPEHENVHVQ
jgi:PPOX class probable F420-dependent enzyme